MSEFAVIVCGALQVTVAAEAEVAATARLASVVAVREDKVLSECLFFIIV